MRKNFKGRIWMLAILALVTLGAIGVGNTDWAQAQDAEQGVMDNSNESGVTERTTIQKVGAFIEQAGDIGKIILAIGAVGLLMLFNEIRTHMVEALGGKSLFHLDTKNLTRKTWKDALDKTRSSELARAVEESLQLFNHTNDVSLLVERASTYRESEESRHSNFQNRFYYLSDAAGGLGLLGTVLGIFRAFSQKQSGMDEAALIGAMGIALVTTFLGIVVSLILNVLAGEMGAAVTRRVQNGQSKLEALQEMLMTENGAHRPNVKLAGASNREATQ